jgi:hypothetical protein
MMPDFKVIFSTNNEEFQGIVSEFLHQRFLKIHSISFSHDVKTQFTNSAFWCFIVYSFEVQT